MSNNSMNLAEVVAKAIEEQRKIQSDKDWRLGEVAKLRKEMNKENEIVDNAFTRLAKDLIMVEDSTIRIKQLRNAFDAVKLDIEAKYKPLLEKHAVALEVTTEALASMAGDKAAALVAPVTKAVDGFWGAFKDRAFIKR